MKFVLHTSEVKFAHYFAVRRNFTHEVNFTIEDNFTCPKGKLSFSVFSVKDNTLNKVCAFTLFVNKNCQNCRFILFCSFFFDFFDSKNGVFFF